MRTGSSGSFQFHTSAHVKTLPVCSFPPRSDITAQGDQTVEPRVGLEPKAPQLSSRPRHSVWASTCTRSWWRCKLATRFCVTLRRRSPGRTSLSEHCGGHKGRGFSCDTSATSQPVVQPGGHIATGLGHTLLTWMNCDGFPKAVLLNHWSLRTHNYSTALKFIPQK